MTVTDTGIGDRDDNLHSLCNGGTRIVGQCVKKRHDISNIQSDLIYLHEFISGQTSG